MAKPIKKPPPKLINKTTGPAAAKEMAAMEQEAKLPPRKIIRRLPQAPGY